MPKIVDHDARRQEMIAATWRIIAEEGIGAATTRRIAEEAGRAHGGLLYYFPNKDALLRAALRFAFDETNRRVAEGPRLRGLAAVRALSEQVMPLDETRRLEARIVLSFWQYALTSETMGGIFEEMMRSWRHRFTEHLGEAIVEGELDAGISIETAVDNLLAMLMGLQALSVFTPAESTPERQRAQLERFLGDLAS